MRRFVSFFLAIVMYLFPTANLPKYELHRDAWNTNYPYIFTHGLNGWGEYSLFNAIVPYWGTLGGDMMQYLNARGITCRSAFTDPNNSAWDCACELYAQITGTRTDYGAAHSAACHHDRFGKDFTGKALLDTWDSEHKVNLLGHSFGGNTLLMLLDLMANGNEAEQNVTSYSSISPLFTGGKGDWIYSVTALASPLNGTTAFELFDQANGEQTIFKRIYELSERFTNDDFDRGKESFDSCAYDMHIDHAVAMTGSFAVLPDVYYFSLPCSSTAQNTDGTWSAKKATEFIMADTANYIGRFTGVTAGGIELNESWLENDGLVNTISEKAPFGAPQKALEDGAIEPGVWNVYPVYNGDHMSVVGGMMHRTLIRPLYLEMIDRINSL